MKEIFFALSPMDTPTAASGQDMLPTVEVVFENQTIIPGNLAISKQGDIYFSVNPLINPTSKLYKVTGKSEAVPYPNDEYVTGKDSVIGGVLGVRIDSENNLWMLDMTKHQYVVWDLDNNVLKQTIAIPDSVLQPNSFLQDFIIDEKHKRLIIADMTMGSADAPVSPAFVVYDMETKEFRRMAEKQPALLSEVAGGFDLNPIAIEPDSEWIYFGAINSRKLYRVAAKSFNDEAALIADIELFGDKSYCDGIVADNDGVVYITNVEDSALGVTTRDGFRNIAMLPEGQVWPDGIYLGHDGCVYSAVSQLSRAAILNDGKDLSIPPFVIVKTPKIM